MTAIRAGLVIALASQFMLGAERRALLSELDSSEPTATLPQRACYSPSPPCQARSAGGTVGRSESRPTSSWAGSYRGVGEPRGSRAARKENIGRYAAYAWCKDVHA